MEVILHFIHYHGNPLQGCLGPDGLKSLNGPKIFAEFGPVHDASVLVLELAEPGTETGVLQAHSAIMRVPSAKRSDTSFNVMLRLNCHFCIQGLQVLVTGTT
jgi:hypothetical protein